jgi:hypothetical protein
MIALTLAAVTGGVLVCGTSSVASPGIDGAPRIDIAPLAGSVSGAAIRWSFGQGYICVVAGTLDIGAVAAIATTILLMP